MKKDNLGAIGSDAQFSGFSAQDFDAYLEKKQRSNAYSLERRRAKDHLIALARELVQMISSSTFEDKELADIVNHLEMGASDEAPTVQNGRRVEAQWVFFTRREHERISLKPVLQKTDLAAASVFDTAVQHQHAVVFLRLDKEGLAFGFDLSGKALVDRKNISAIWSETWGKEKWVEALASLDQKTDGQCVVGTKDHFCFVKESSAEHIETWQNDLLNTDKRFFVELQLKKEELQSENPEFISNIENWISPFFRLYHGFAWSFDNDQMGLRETVQQKKKEQKQKIQETKSFQAGDRVTILSGLFSGRGGYLAEIDEKGKAKVMVGPVSVTVDVKDLKDG